MDLPEQYDAIIQQGERNASIMLALVPAEEGRPHSMDIERALFGAGLGVTRVAPATEGMFLSTDWELEVEIGDPEQESGRFLRVWVEPNDVPDELLEWSGVDEVSVEAGKRCEWMLGVGIMFGAEPLSDFHLQLRVLSAIAPDCVLILDMSAQRAHTGDWLHDMAASDVPPAPQNLFMIHYVHDDTRKNGRCWLHTHGLLRCGTIEIEMLDIPVVAASNMGHLMNVIAPMFIETGTPEADVPFQAGAGVQPVWLPWEEGVKRFGRGCIGTGEDREDGHEDPSGVLFARSRGLFGVRYRSPARWNKLLSGNPILYVSTMETDRMALLATRRFSRFAELQRRFGAASDYWAFLVKLGYQVDGAENEEQREHLWFVVHEVQGDTVDATLTNQPYYIARMKEGQRGKHSLLRLTDWNILCEHGSFNPDTVLLLERIVEEIDGAAQ